MASLITASVALTCAFSGWLLHRSLRRCALPSSLDRLFARMLPWCAALTVACFLRNILNAPFPNWNAARLASAFAVRLGYPLYPDRNGGPLLVSLHTPFSSLAYLPATVAPNPTLAVIAGVLLSLGFVLLPAFWILRKAYDGPRRHLTDTAVLVWLCLACVQSFALSYTVFWIRADDPAMALSSAAVAVPVLATRRSARVLLLAAALAVLAAWTKQTFAVVIPALLIYVLAVDGWQVFGKFMAALGIAGAALSAPFLVAFPLQQMWMNTMTIPSRHPWYTAEQVTGAIGSGAATDLADKVKTAMASGLELFQASFVFLILIGFLIVVDLATDKREMSLRQWIRSNRSSGFLIAALALAPISIINRSKLGGEASSHAGTVWFLALAAAVLLARAAASARPVCALYGKALLAALLATFSIAAAPGLPSLWKISRDVSGNPQQAAFQYAKRHRGVYFPWNPLSTMMAEGKAYHFEFGILDRERGAIPVTQQQFLTFVPANPSCVAFPPHPWEDQPRLVLRYLPGLSQQVTDAELPGWDLFVPGLTNSTGAQRACSGPPVSERFPRASYGRNSK